mmetsp:Transcript_28053/g.67977  ORF Transcript_28053/g.67977 Transcript_28053/m.67977 type:complete len:166 (+) Transcript_28053:422-919(+)
MAGKVGWAAAREAGGSLVCGEEHSVESEVADQAEAAAGAGDWGWGKPVVVQKEVMRAAVGVALAAKQAGTRAADAAAAVRQARARVFLAMAKQAATEATMAPRGSQVDRVEYTVVGAEDSEVEPVGSKAEVRSEVEGRLAGEQEARRVASVEEVAVAGAQQVRVK